MRKHFLSTIVAATFLAGCGQDRLAGGSSSTGNALSARVVHLDGTSSEGDSVILRTAPGDSVARTVALAICDAQGRVVFAQVPDQPLTLEARGFDQGRFSPVRTADREDGIELRSAAYASLEGRILLTDSVASGRAVLAGTGQAAGIDDSGRFRFDRVSPGAHEVSARPRLDGGLGVAIWKEVEVASGRQVALAPSAPSRARSTDWRAVWIEDFQTFDTSRWNIDTGDGCPDLCGWGKGSLQRFLPANTLLREGSLVLEARKSPQGWSSGQVQTRGKFQFRQGRLEIDARLPGARGAWSLLSLQGDSTGRVWPQAGAIDIAGLWGYRPDSLMGIAHFADASNTGFHPGTTFAGGVPWSERLATYAIEWNEREILWLADDRVYFRMATNPSFAHSFYLSLGLTVGGDGNVAPSDTASFALWIDQIRLFQKPD